MPVAPADVPRLKAELDNDTRDVADLWTDALRKYKGVVGDELTPRFPDVAAMIQFGTQEMENFHQFRHNKKKVDKLRGLFKDNLEYIEKGAQQLISAATPAFPPAAAIGTALTMMLSACRQVSADYDVVTAFFEDMNAFLQRITILESRLPKYRAYRNCLMDVFTSVLDLCGFAIKYVELGRFKKWILSMVRGEDSDLGGARTKMDTSLSRLQSATEYAILGNTEELQRMNSDLQQNQDLQMRMAEEQTRMLETVMQSQESVRSDLKNIQKLLVMFEQRRREDPAGGSGGKQRDNKSTGPQNGKPPTSNRVKSCFEDTINPEHEWRNIKDSAIPETGLWIFDEPEWGRWISAQEQIREPEAHTEVGTNEADGRSAASLPILILRGPPGVGKSHLAASAYDRLSQQARQDTSGSNTCVSHFYFRETTKDLNEFHNAVNWAVIQVAEQNSLLCEKLCAEIQREDVEWNSWNWRDVWETLIKPIFHRTSSPRASLQLVWDGLDELQFEEKDALKGFLTEIKGATDLNISLFCTTRNDVLDEPLKAAGAEMIDVSKEKQLADIKALIWSHLNNDTGLKKFTKYMKQTISNTLEEKANGRMLYVEHMLRQFNTLGREPIVLKAMQQHMPDGLEALYLGMLADLQHHTGPEDLKAMKCLFWWLSFSYRPLTLAECLSILTISTTANTFDLERELQGRQLAKLIRIGDYEERMVEDTPNSTIPKLALDKPRNADAVEAAYNDGDLPLRFQERSMRGFFRDLNSGGDETLRTLKKDANRHIFIFCARILSGETALETVHESLRKYAAETWAWHLSWTVMTQDSETDQIMGLEALGGIMSNEGNRAAKILESLDFDYDAINQDFSDGLLMKHIIFFAGIAAKLGDKASPATSAWAKSVVGESETAFVPLAKGHIDNWLRAKDFKAALRAFRFAHTAIKMTNLHSLIKDQNQSKSSDSDWDEDAEETLHYSKEEIVGIFDAFDDIHKDANAYWAVAALLEHSGHYSAALPYAKRASEECPSTEPENKLRVLDLLANVHLGRKDYEAANEAICSGLAGREGIPPKLLRTGLVTRARVEVALKRIEDAMASYEGARMADPEEPMPGDILKDEFKIYRDRPAAAEVISLVRKWKPMERLAWMTWNYDDKTDAHSDQHHSFQRAAGLAGEREYLVQAYEEAIQLLDSLDAAAPMRYQLAIAHWEIRGDVEAAKAILTETLDSSSNLEPLALTNEDPAYSLVCAVTFMAEILYAQFRSTPDPNQKAQLFVEAKELTKKSLAQSIPTPKSELVYHTLTLARMARRVSSALEFQETLQKAFDTCYEALVDTVGWNDALNVTLLAAVLSNLEGLEREVEILVSAQFSQLDPSVAFRSTNGDSHAKEGKEDRGDGEDTSDEDGDESDESSSSDDDDDEKLPTDEGDLSDVWCSCYGVCDPPVVWSAWKGRTLYQCVTCNNAVLCEACHQKRQTYNEGGLGFDDAICREHLGQSFCGRNHRYVKGPVPGWKGITDGVMTIDAVDGGRDALHVSFREWLEELKNVKWKAAWERWWLKED